MLLNDRAFFKTVQFRKPTYLGDPLNILRIFNDKEVDELFILDISGTGPDMEFLRELASECFMPLAYGGGVREIGQIAALFEAGFEKVSVNTAAVERPALVTEAARRFGSQSIVVSIDVKRKLLGGDHVVTHGGRQTTDMTAREGAQRAEQLGAGEILLNAVDRDGTMKGYDLPLVSLVSSAVSIPVVACGGAGSVADLRSGIEAGAAAVAAGSLFVYKGDRRAVLINMPSREETEVISGAWQESK